VGVSLTGHATGAWAAAGLAVRGGLEPHDDPATPAPWWPPCRSCRGDARSQCCGISLRQSAECTHSPHRPRVVTGYRSACASAGGSWTTAARWWCGRGRTPSEHCPTSPGTNRSKVRVALEGGADRGCTRRPSVPPRGTRRAASTGHRPPGTTASWCANSMERPTAGAGRSLDADPKYHRGAGRFVPRVGNPHRGEPSRGWLAQGAEVEAVIGGLLTRPQPARPPPQDSRRARHALGHGRPVHSRTYYRAAVPGVRRATSCPSRPTADSHR